MIGTNIGVLGEKRFLADLLPSIYADSKLLGGFGNDAAVIEVANAPFNLILKTDRASFPVSLKRGWSGYRTWGQMAVTANCSDILASGGQPLACMLAIMVPGYEAASHVRDIVLGASDECRANGIIYAGGDTKEASEPQVVGSAVGSVAKDGLLARNTAKPGDRLFCAGRIGGFAGAYFLLKHVFNNEKTQVTQPYIDYISHPTAQWRVAREINARKVAHSAMDASDGLLDVLQTFAAAGVRLQLDLDRIPYHEFALECAARTRIPLTQLIFGGGDWNILYCIPAAEAHQLVNLETHNFHLYLIGEVTDGHGVYAVDADKKEHPISGVVNEHFKNRIEDAASFMDHIEKDDFLR